MIVVFRVDASHLIGIGHVMRCLTLASALFDQGADCRFICREQPGNLIDFIRSKGFYVDVLPGTERFSGSADATIHAHFLSCSQAQDARECSAILKTTFADWLIVDHYGLDCRWEEAMLPCYEMLMVIDDLADRSHQCNVLLDQTFGRSKRDYANLVPAGCRLMCGSQFSLLRPEFATIREYSLQRRASNPTLQRLLVTMGGVDKDNATNQVLQSLQQTGLPERTEIVVVMGPHAPWLQAVQAQAAKMPWPTSVLVNVDNMAELMAESDLAIGAAGTTAWERCCLGLPCIMVVLADNQLLIADQLSQVGAAHLLELSLNGESITPIAPMLFAPDALTRMSQNASTVTNGRGVQYTLDLLSRSQVP